MPTMLSWRSVRAMKLTESNSITYLFILVEHRPRTLGLPWSIAAAQSHAMRITTTPVKPYTCAGCNWQFATEEHELIIEWYVNDTVYQH